MSVTDHGLRAWPGGSAENDASRILKTPLTDLMGRAAALRDAGFGDRVTYSRKVFIPLTRLCRDVCHYCTFAQPPQKAVPPFLHRDQVLAIARTGQEAGCTEALFTLGDKPELRYRVARDALRAEGHETTIDLLADMARLVLEETGLLPHLNPGVLSAADFATLRPVAASMGLMVEGTASHLCEPGGPHYGSPDKDPALRLDTLRLAGEARVPFTTGILIGIGETREERIHALLEIRDLHRRYGHVQEIIIQNFRAKPGTRMADTEEPDLDELCWSIAAARCLFGSSMSIQAPPNLSGEDYPRLIDAGINDWGGVSPVTPDHVNPEAAWPELRKLERSTNRKSRLLLPRLPVYPRYVFESGWLDAAIRPAVLRAMDSDGLARNDIWSPGVADRCPAAPATAGGRARKFHQILKRSVDGHRLEEGEITALLGARGAALGDVMAAANDLRRRVSGDDITYVVNRNINYTNVCGYRCGFCAFSKGRLSANLRGTPYDLALEEIARRAAEAWRRGATEVCLQGGIHPDYTGNTYLSILKAVKEAAPAIHVHAFSPLEVTQGASTLGLPVEVYLSKLRDAGLGSLPGTAAEILDQEVRAVLCPDKLSTEAWIEVMEAAHRAGLRSTATIMFGHVERPCHKARHLLRVRDLQERTGVFTEFVPLPFVHMEAPIYLRGQARRGPTFREAVLMHSAARLVLHPVLSNIQTSWVKLGSDGARMCLEAGANDLGGTLMNETISRSAGAAHGQELTPEAMHELICGMDRIPRQRSTLFGEVAGERSAAAAAAPQLEPVVLTRATRYAHGASLS